MIWSDLRKCNIEDVVGYINEKLIEFGSLKKIADTLEANESTIRKYLTSKGYKRVGDQFVLKDDTCNLREHTQSNSKKGIDMTTENTSVINLPDMKENMIYISNEMDTLKDMIQWFKTRDDKSNTGVIELREGIKIDLPEANIKRTTIRINEAIWNEFDKFVEDNRPYEKHTLMAQALKEFMDKYK